MPTAAQTDAGRADATEKSNRYDILSYVRQAINLPMRNVTNYITFFSYHRRRF